LMNQRQKRGSLRVASAKKKQTKGEGRLSIGRRQANKEGPKKRRCRGGRVRKKES